MRLWPEVDRDVRRRLLAEVRRRHNVEASGTDAGRRLARLDELVALARAIGGPNREKCGSDEPPEVWVRMKARLRQAGGRT